MKLEIVTQLVLNLNRYIASESYYSDFSICHRFDLFLIDLANFHYSIIDYHLKIIYPLIFFHQTDSYLIFQLSQEKLSAFMGNLHVKFLVLLLKVLVSVTFEDYCFVNFWTDFSFSLSKKHMMKMCMIFSISCHKKSENETNLVIQEVLNHSMTLNGKVCSMICCIYPMNLR